MKGTSYMLIFKIVAVYSSVIASSVTFSQEVVLDTITKGLIDGTPTSLFSNLKKDSSQTDFGINSIGIGTFISSAPLGGISTNQSSQLNESYWIDLDLAIGGLPININSTVGNWYTSFNPIIQPGGGFSVSQLNFAFDHESFLQGKKDELLSQLDAKLPDWIREFEEVAIQDSLEKYNQLKYQFSDSLYKVSLDHARSINQSQLDSIKLGFSIDSCATLMADSILIQHAQNRQQFKSTMAFQEEYNRLNQEYLNYQMKINSASELISSSKNQIELSSLAAELGIETSNRNLAFQGLQQFEFGQKYILHTPLTLYNYASVGLNTEYQIESSSIGINILSRNLMQNISLTGLNDTISVSPAYSDQNAALLYYSQQKDRSKITLTGLYINLKENVQSGYLDRMHSVFSIYNEMNLTTYFKLNLELAFAGRNSNANVSETNSEYGNLLSQFGIFSELVSKECTFLPEIGVDGSYIGLNYSVLGNPLLLPGSQSIGGHISKSFLENKMSVSYSFSNRKSLSENTVQQNQLIQTFSLLCTPTPNWRLQAEMLPFSAGFGIDGLDNATYNQAGNAVVVSLVGQQNIGNNISLNNFFTYSNYSYQSQSSYVDTLMLLNGKYFTYNGSWTFYSVVLLSNVHWNFSESSTIYNQINSGQFQWQYTRDKMHFSIGPKFLEHSLYFDQLGGMLTFQLPAFYGLTSNLNLEKYMSIKRENDLSIYPSSTFFYISMFYTLNFN